MYGARPIRRWVQENVVTMISEMLVKGEAGAGSRISIDATDDKGLKYEVVREVADPDPIDSGNDFDLDVVTPVINENMRSEKTNPPRVSSGDGLNLYLPVKAL